MQLPRFLHGDMLGGRRNFQGLGQVQTLMLSNRLPFFETPPKNKQRLGRILPKPSLPFKTYSESGGGFRGSKYTVRARATAIAGVRARAGSREQAGASTRAKQKQRAKAGATARAGADARDAAEAGARARSLKSGCGDKKKPENKNTF